jgi:hypothetical protein
METKRRSFLRGLATSAGAWTALGTGASKAGSYMSPGPPALEQSTVRDKFWIWGHVEGSHNNQYGLQGTSRMTPAEGAFYLNVPNIVMVAYPSAKEPCKMLPTAPYDPYLISFRPLKRIVFSIVGAGGAAASKQDLEMLSQLVQKYPNIVGVQMDDFFRETFNGGRTGTLTPEELDFVQTKLKGGTRKLGLWITVYRHDLQYDLSSYLNKVDVVTFWTWKGKDLDSLEEGFGKCEQAIPNARKVLGCYMWDYGDRKPLPVSLMQRQCDLGLDWLRKGRIDGLIFLASCICDLNLESVEWTRNWIRKVGDTEM